MAKITKTVCSICGNANCSGREFAYASDPKKKPVFCVSQVTKKISHEFEEQYVEAKHGKERKDWCIHDFDVELYAKSLGMERAPRKWYHYEAVGMCQWDNLEVIPCQ